MTHRSIAPRAGEYNSYYAGYIALVPAGDIVRQLAFQGGRAIDLLSSVSPQQSLHRYAPGKWSMREVLSHIIDAERIFTYRALRIGRGDKTPLPGFEQDDYVAACAADKREWASLYHEFQLVRQATVILFETLPDEAWQREGIASTFPVSVRALAWITAGHEAHHLRILRERYLPSM